MDAWSIHNPATDAIVLAKACLVTIPVLPASSPS
jgi:hypothetical protein